MYTRVGGGELTYIKNLDLLLSTSGTLKSLMPKKNS